MPTDRSPLADFREVECAKCEPAGRNGEPRFEVTIAGQGDVPWRPNPRPTLRPPRTVGADGRR